jgi:hypothetical protein
MDHVGLWTGPILGLAICATAFACSGTGLLTGWAVRVPSWLRVVALLFGLGGFLPLLARLFGAN